MTKEDKDLLRKDLSGRLPYGVIMSTPIGSGHLNSIDQTIFGTEYGINISAVSRDFFNDSKCEVKPYLRPMSEFTDYEDKEFALLQTGFYTDGMLYPIAANAMITWLNKHHFDYRGLIEKGLAIEAPVGMYDK